jgi:16S rRNA (guanine527-N7)-methyltransferase
VKSPLSEDEQAKLKAYSQLVRAWSSKLDLVSPGDLDRFEERHIADSLRVLDLLSEVPSGPCMDIGSGAGLPGIPLAIVSDRHWRLLEPRRRRAAFLEEVVRELNLDCEVIAKSAEEAAEDPRLASRHVFATVRALAPPEKAQALLQPLLQKKGIGAIFLGESAESPSNSRLWRPGIAIVESTVPG